MEEMSIEDRLKLAAEDAFMDAHEAIFNLTVALNKTRREMDVNDLEQILARRENIAKCQILSDVLKMINELHAKHIEGYGV